MARLGYVYNRRAADMRTERSRTLGLVATDVRNPYFAELMMAVEEAASKAGYTLLQGFSRDEAPRQRRLLETMVSTASTGSSCCRRTALDPRTCSRPWEPLAFRTF